MLLRKCNTCEKEERQRNLKRIGKEWFCSECYKIKRLNHRKESIKEAGIEEELKELRHKSEREFREKNKEKLKEYYKRRYHEKNPTSEYYNKGLINLERDSKPRVNGIREKKPTSNCYLTLQEKRLLFSYLLKNGLSYESAGERISELVKRLSDLRFQLKEKKKSEEEIVNKSQRMIQELYTSF
jgi:hypothetical protein